MARRTPKIGVDEVKRVRLERGGFRERGALHFASHTAFADGRDTLEVFFREGNAVNHVSGVRRVVNFCWNIRSRSTRDDIVKIIEVLSRGASESNFVCLGIGNVGRGCDHGLV